MMSLDFSKWLAGGSSLVKAQIPIRAAIQASRILDKDTSIVLARGLTRLPAQIVRLEYQDWATGDTSDMGVTDMRKLTVFGIKDHPTLPDTNIQDGDTFILESKEFTVINVNRQLHGQVQAHAEAVG